MMIYFIQIKRFRVFVGSHLVTGQNKNPLQNYDIDIYCISIQGTKKRRRRFFLLRNMLGGKPSHSQKKTAFTVVFATNPPASISAVPPKKKTSTSIEVKNPQDLMHLQHDKDVVVFWKKVSFGGGGENIQGPLKDVTWCRNVHWLSWLDRYFSASNVFFLGGCVASWW